ncbi:uncharacterized protein LOC127251750 [Andrographis paniculata]|uniref:uncharacterized protein LOC127251750 n=1 Tax=Andrographis paniculata TaxID=175694 RepID=UPI0021E9464C|nr:uncharacterized protein LOC127251750 [Andrographis paniculata]
MTRKKTSKGVVLKSQFPYGGVGYEEAGARHKRETLVQDYEELQKEVNAMRSKLEVAKQKRRILDAEVRFLRRKYKSFVKTKDMNLSQECVVSMPTSLKQLKNTKELISGGKEAKRRRLLPPLPDARPKKKQPIGKQVAMLSPSPATVLAQISSDGKESVGYGFDLISGSSHRGQMHINSEAFVPIINPAILDKDRSLALAGNGAAVSYSVGDFDLSQYNNPSGLAASIRNHRATFDLNEISTGDEDVQNNMFEESKKSLTRGLNINNDEQQQNDLKFSMCRNPGEGSARVGSKRKISWQDPVALRV